MTDKQGKPNAGDPGRCLRFLFCAAALLLIASMAAPACGYHRVRPGNNLPPGIRTVAIPVFRNDTYESGIEVLMTDALREQFVRSGFVRLVSVKQADAVVVGTISKFSVKALSFSEFDYAVEYRAHIQMRMKLVSKDGTVLWEDSKLSRREEYRVSADIFTSEEARQQATERIARDLMADVHDRIFDGFEMEGGFVKE